MKFRFSHSLVAALGAQWLLVFSAQAGPLTHTDPTLSSFEGLTELSGPVEATPGVARASLLVTAKAPTPTQPLDGSFFTTLNLYLAQQNYNAIVAQIAAAHAQAAPAVLAWLEQASRAGHIRLMWELSEGLALSGKPEESMYWSYPAMVGTMQEQDLCTLSETRFASTDLKNTHPLSRQAAIDDSFASKNAMRFAFQLLARLPSQSPLWICQAYAKNPAAQRNFIQSELMWGDLRRRARMRLARRLFSPPTGWTEKMLNDTVEGNPPDSLWAR